MEDLFTHVATFLRFNEIPAFAAAFKWKQRNFWATYYHSTVRPELVKTTDLAFFQTFDERLGDGTFVMSVLLSRHCVRCNTFTELMVGAAHLCCECADKYTSVAITGAWFFGDLQPQPHAYLEDIIESARPGANVLLPAIVAQRGKGIILINKPLRLQGCAGGSTILLKGCLCIRASVIMDNIDVRLENESGYGFLSPPEPELVVPAIQMSMCAYSQVLVMRNCQVTSSLGTGILLFCGRFYADNVKIYQCAYAGICLGENISLRLALPRVQNCTFTNIASWAVQVECEDHEAKLHLQIRAGNTIVSDNVFFRKE